MPARYLQPDATDMQYRDNGDVKRQRYRLHETTDGTSDWLIIPGSIGDILVTVTPTTNARVEYTQASIGEVIANTATGEAWEGGDVAVKTTRTMVNAVTAVRFVGNGSWTVTA
jgi:hypothetical protein